MAEPISEAEWQSKKQHQIKAILKKNRQSLDPSLNPWSIAISYRDGGPEQSFYRKNEKISRIPASLTKLITSIAILKRFEGGHHFVTQILTNDQLKGKVLEGSIYLKGGGSPSFVSESMWVLVNEFVRSGIQTITGDIVVDDQRFDSTRFDEGRDPERVNRAYDAPIGAMSFNWNAVNVYVRPSEKVGTAAQVFADPQSDFINVVNKVKTTAGSRASVTVRRISGQDDHPDSIEVIGQIGVGAKEQVKYVSISRPDVWSGYQLKSFLQQRGIAVKGKVKTGVTPLAARVLVEKESKPLALILRDMMKFSNNYVAEMLTKNLGAEFHSQPASMGSGLETIQQTLVQMGFAKDEFVISSPSGLSRKNTTTAESLHRLLLEAKSDFLVYPEFLQSLPVAGIDGTLKSRMKGSPAQGRVRAKTGMLADSGVLGLAGYISREDSRAFTFVFLYNGTSKGISAAMQTMDQLCEALAGE